MAHPLFGPEVRLALKTNDTEGLKTVVENLHPSTVAEILSEDEFSPSEVWQILGTAEYRKQANVFEYFPPAWQVTLADKGDPQQVAKIIEHMAHDERVDLLRRLSSETSERVLKFVDEASQRDIKALAGYEEGTVGSLMTTDYAWVPSDITINQAIERLRQQAADRETIYYIYTLDEQTRRLKGVFTLQEMILASPNVKVNEIMESGGLVTLRPQDEPIRAAELLRKYDFLALPVVDDEGRLLGIVTHDDVLDLIDAEATEDLQRQAAVGHIEGSYLDAGFVNVWRKRTGWLSMLFVAEMLTYNVTTIFEEPIENVKVLKYFIPLCIATGGNSGTQAATLVLRAMALGQISPKDWMRILRFELFMGMAMGFALGIIGIGRAQLVSSDMLVYEGERAGQPVDRFYFSIMLGIIVMLICMAGTLTGAMFPLILKRVFKADPALASGPAVATLIDVLGIVILFGIAWVFLL